MEPADSEPHGPPKLTFDEDEVATVAAAVAAGWARQTRQGVERELAARQAIALEQAAIALAEAARAQRHADERIRGEAIRLAEAIMHAFLAGMPDDDGHRPAAVVRCLLQALPEPTTAAVQVVVDGLAAEPLRARLPDIAAQAGFAGSFEILADPQLAPGAVQLRWPGGWSEHAPARIAGQIAELLAAHRAAAPDSTGALSDATSFTSGNEHRYDHD